MSTRREREALTDLDLQIQVLDRQIQLLDQCRRRLERHLRTLRACCEAEPRGEFSADDIEKLLRLNQRLEALEIELKAIGERESARLKARVADPEDPLDDYEIDATLYFTLREDDPEFDENDDNVLTRREIGLKRFESLADGEDYRESVVAFPGRLGTEPHCWLFHDLYDHSYGVEAPALSLHDCLRVGSLWVDVAVRHQATLEIDTGTWLQPAPTQR